MTSVGFVVAHYSESFVLPTLRMLDRIGLSEEPHHTIFVANQETAHSRLSETLGSRVRGSWELMRHDNSGMEFGAYQAGIDALVKRMDADWIVVGNDTFATHNNFPRVYRETLSQALQRAPAYPTIIGRTHALARSYQIEGLRTHRWVQTSLFAINRAALEALDGRIYRPELESLISDSADLSTFFSPDVDPVLRDHLETWLFRARPGPHWYASEPLQSKNISKMARKARSILQEKYVAAILDSAGADFVNLNDLPITKKILRKIDDMVFELSQSRLRAI